MCSRWSLCVKLVPLVLCAAAGAASASPTLDCVGDAGVTQDCLLSYTDSAGAPQTRPVEVLVPTGQTQPLPLVVFLHGAPGNERRCLSTQWRPTCGAGQCILACPQGGAVSYFADGGLRGYGWNSVYGKSD